MEAIRNPHTVKYVNKVHDSETLHLLLLSRAISIPLIYFWLSHLFSYPPLTFWIIRAPSQHLSRLERTEGTKPNHSIFVPANRASFSFPRFNASSSHLIDILHITAIILFHSNHYVKSLVFNRK